MTMLTLVIGFIAYIKAFSGGAGIVLDDLMAGALAAFLLKAIYLMVI